MKIAIHRTAGGGNKVLATAAALGLAVAVVGGGGCWRASEAGFKKWTADEIAAHPVDYLDFCQGQVKQTQEKLKGQQISIAQSKASVQARRDDAADTADGGDRTLAELKDTYRSASKADAWPATWNGQHCDQEWLHDNIQSTFQQVASKRRIVAQCDASLATLKALERKIPLLETQADSQLNEIETDREVVKVGAISQEFRDQLVTLKGMVQSTEDGAGNTNPPPINLNDPSTHAGGSAGGVSTVSFDQIMSK